MRHQRLAPVLQRAVSNYYTHHWPLEGARIFTTVTQVVVAENLRSARISLSLFTPQPEVIYAALQKEIWQLRHHLHTLLGGRMHRVPMVILHLDQSAVKAAQIDTLLRKKPVHD